ncbi:MAG: hypothetical protein QOD06_2728 [Candidatus Binatota bacterium]|nr:hypothetical protein [Candidatus Binatota bacterium]
MGYRTIAFECFGGVAEVELARPERLNAVNRRMVDEIADVASGVAADRTIRALVFRGRGRAFSAGADISELSAYESAGEPLDHIERIQNVYSEIERLPIPTVAAIHGFAYGGGLELALCCDFRILAADAKLGVPEIKIGVLPGAGGTQRLSRMLPPAIAKQMILLGESLDAEAALRHGLVNRVVAADDVLEAARAIAAQAATLPPLALRSGKLMIHSGAYGGLERGIEAERQAMAFLFATEDRREGMRAFLEKRPPHFEGR